jgi:hypothetical protein
MPFSQLLLDNWKRYDNRSREGKVDISRMSLLRLRKAVQNNQVSFPSPVPVFVCHARPDIQWRVVALYFVRNWSCSELGARYGTGTARVRQILSNWVQRAIVLGYLQEIPAVNPPLAEDVARNATTSPDHNALAYALAIQETPSRSLDSARDCPEFR